MDVVKLFASRALLEHDMGALLCRNTQKSAHPPVWQTCSAHGHSFTRLQYIYRILAMQLEIKVKLIDSLNVSTYPFHIHWVFFVGESNEELDGCGISLDPHHNVIDQENYHIYQHQHQYS